MEKITMSVEDLENAAFDSVWFPICPNCERETPAERDAEMVYCIHCDALIEIDNSYF